MKRVKASTRRQRAVTNRVESPTLTMADVQALLALRQAMKNGKTK